MSRRDAIKPGQKLKLPGGGTRNAVPLYDVPAHRILHHLVMHPPVRTSALRGLGALPNVFAVGGTWIAPRADIAAAWRGDGTTRSLSMHPEA